MFFFLVKMEGGRKWLAAACKMSPRLCRADGDSGAALQGFGAAELATKAEEQQININKYTAEVNSLRFTFLLFFPLIQHPSVILQSTHR